MGGFFGAIGISGMMRYSVGGKIPPEDFFQSFGMKMPKGYTGENVNADIRLPEISMYASKVSAIV